MQHVYELPPTRFGLAAPLFEPAWFDEMYMEAVLIGWQPGRIFVDDPDKPTAAVMFRTYEYYIAGDADSPALRQFLKDAPAEPGVFQDFYGYAPVGKAWEQALLTDYGDDLMVIMRRNYGWADAPIMDWRAALPAGAWIVPITWALAERIDREWRETIGLLWDGYENYERLGYGFCLMVGDDLGSMATTDGIGRKAANIGVRTAEQYRRQGFARMTCSAFIEHTLARGLLPTWDCDDMNERSKALAQALGFVEREPFSQLSRPGYQALRLSAGLWRAGPGEEGVTRWTRTR